MSYLPVDCLSLIFQDLDLSSLFVGLQVSKSIYSLLKNAKKLRLGRAVRLNDLRRLWPQSERCPILSGTIVLEPSGEEYLEGLRYQELKIICLGKDGLPLSPKFRNLALQAITDHSKTLIISSMQGFDITFTEGYIPHPSYLFSLNIEDEACNNLPIKGIRCSRDEIGQYTAHPIQDYTDFWIYPGRGGYGEDIAELLGAMCLKVKRFRCDYHLGSMLTLRNLPNLEEFRGVISLEEYIDMHVEGHSSPFPSLKVIGIYLEDIDIMERWNSGCLWVLMSYYLYVPEEMVSLVKKEYGNRKGLLEVLGIPKTDVSFES